MKKSASKLIVFGAIVFVSSMTSCKTGGGYGCHYTEINIPSKLDTPNSIEQQESKHTYKVTKNVSE